MLQYLWALISKEIEQFLRVFMQFRLSFMQSAFAGFGFGSSVEGKDTCY